MRSDIGSSAVYRARVSQDLRRVPVLQHCLVLVRQGAKELVDGLGAVARVAVGDTVLLHAGGHPTIGNRPDPAAGHYAALVLAFGARSLTAFRQLYPTLAAAPPLPSRAWSLRPGDTALAAAIGHACDGLEDAALSDRVALHRCVEVLAVLAERGLVLPDGDDPGAAAAVQGLVAARPHLPWSAADVARALNISEATLRRRLAAEGTCFRDLAADVRLGYGLHLLQTTRQPIIEVAAACGYDSPSRFAARFRARFGMSPSELQGKAKSA